MRRRLVRMKLNYAEALRWLEQAKHNLDVAEHILKARFFSDTCFMAEQAAQVALKAFIIYHKKRLVWEHSVLHFARTYYPIGQRV
jgi:HEPN domain-containing protein